MYGPTKSDIYIFSALLVIGGMVLGAVATMFVHELADRYRIERIEQKEMSR